MPCLSHNKTRKRLSINRARYNKVMSQHNITIQKHKNESSATHHDMMTI